MPTPSQRSTGRRAYWRLLSEPWVFFRHAYRLGLRVPEFPYVPGPGSRFTPATGIPPILVTALPHLSDDPEGPMTKWRRSPPVDQPPPQLSTGACSGGFAIASARALVERSGSSLRI